MSKENILLAEVLGATLFAARAHRNHKRKTGGAYIEHPISVAARLVTAGVDDVEVIQAALLHDTVEDTDVTLEEIRHIFGDTVCLYVGEVTDDKEFNKAKRKRLQVEHAKTSSPGAFLIKMADALDNLTGLLDNPPPTWTAERIRGYFVWKKRVVAARGESVNQNLEQQLSDVFARALVGVKSEDEEKLLSDYYTSMETCND